MKLTIGLGIFAIAGLVFMAADHIDAPGVVVSGLEGTTSDITDVYAFQGENTANLVLVANVKGLLSPAATSTSSFDENVLVEFNIDTDNNDVADLVLQAIPRGGKMYFFGPVAPSSTGLNSTVVESATRGSVDITAYGSSAVISTDNGMKLFAGPRDDPFFFDFLQYNEVIAGNASSFNDPGSDTFAGTNVMSIVAEVPKSMIGGTGSINTWVESKRKQ